MEDPGQEEPVELHGSFCFSWVEFCSLFFVVFSSSPSDGSVVSLAFSFIQLHREITENVLPGPSLCLQRHCYSRQKRREKQTSRMESKTRSLERHFMSFSFEYFCSKWVSCLLIPLPSSSRRQMMIYRSTWLHCQHKVSWETARSGCDLESLMQCRWDSYPDIHYRTEWWVLWKETVIAVTLL